VRLFKFRTSDVGCATYASGKTVRHHWAGETLHTFLASGEVLSLRVCDLCGLILAKRYPTGKGSAKFRLRKVEVSGG
jgi:hypothetical protein